MCPYCGYEVGEPADEPYFLYPGMVLNDRYVVGEVKGFGGFGITYKAFDKTLETVVAIKEHYYSGIVTRKPGTQDVAVYAQNRVEEYQLFLNRFINEARYTAKFSKNNNIVNVFDYFQANNTAYMVMEFLEGVTLREFLKKDKMGIEQCVSTIREICSAVKAIHSENIIHRDISPDNIMLCTDGRVKLFDFGAARFTKHEDQKVAKLTQIMKPGFSPPEQYQTISKQGAWTDIYAIGATLYFMMTGTKPIESTNRKKEDKLISPNEINASIPEYINDTILRAMAIDMHLRFNNVDDFRKSLCKEKKVLNVEKEKKSRMKKRLISVGCATLAIIIGFFIFFNNYNQQRLAETLPDTGFEFWFSLPDDDVRSSTKIMSLEAIVTVFNESFPNVDIGLIAFSEDEYINAIEEALESGTLPSLFESTSVSASVLHESQSVETAFNEIDLTSVFFFDEFEYMIPEANKFPLGFVKKAMFTNIVPTLDGNVTDDERELFLLGETEVFVGSTADFFDVQRALPGRYSLELVYENGFNWTFTDFLSIGNNNNNQLRAVNRFLVFLLSENAQDFLHIQHQSGSLPLNRSALLNEYVFIYEEFDILIDALSD